MKSLLLSVFASLHFIFFSQDFVFKPKEFGIIQMFGETFKFPSDVKIMIYDNKITVSNALKRVYTFKAFYKDGIINAKDKGGVNIKLLFRNDTLFVSVVN